MARRGSIALIGLVMVLGCEEGGAPASGSSVASNLLKHMSFLNAEKRNGGLPDATDMEATIFPLGPTTVAEPGEPGIMALDVADPNERPVEATLMQFGDEDGHIRIPASESEGSTVIENRFEAADLLCEGLCDVVFTVVVHEAVEFDDGKVSQSTVRQIVVDCREHGDPAACEALSGDGGIGNGQGELPCGDVTKGEVALTRDPVTDSHLDAVRQLAANTEVLSDSVHDALADLADGLALPEGASADEVAAEIEARVTAATTGGLFALVADRGCALPLSGVSFALRNCDVDGVSDLMSMPCLGKCEPRPGAQDACAAAPTTGCRGFFDVATSCSGTCKGQCQVALSGESCAGTCVGTCNQSCPDDGNGGCNGPCSGECTGDCYTLSSATCDGSCAGVCDTPSVGTPDCAAPLTAYCDAAVDASIECPGDCFGDVTLASGIELCRDSAVSVGRIRPRCEPVLVQLSFGFGAGLSNSDQDDFATLIDDARVPFAKVFEALTRIDLLATASTELLAAAQDGVPERIAERLADDPDNAGLQCANDQLPDEIAWLQEQNATLQNLQAEIMSVVATLMISQ